MSIDPLAEKYAGVSPYAYCFSNPVNLTDPTGMGPEKKPGEVPPKGGVRIILNIGGSEDSDDSAQTRINEIKKDHPADKIIYIVDSNLGNLKKNIESQIKVATDEGYGKTLELSVFSHSAKDGPIGKYVESNSLDLSKTTHDAADAGQMSISNWVDIDYNFDSNKSLASFYGCNSASFAEKFLSNISSLRYSAGIAGKAGGTYNNKAGSDFNNTVSNWFGFTSSSGVYMRAKDEDTNKVLPMYLYTRGSYTKFGDYKSYNEREFYGNPTTK